MKTNTINWKSLAVVIGIAVLMAAAAIAPACACDDHGRVRVAPRDSVAYGRTYGEWSAAWRQWTDSMQPASHPLFDSAPCSKGQSGPVWFLGGRFCGSEEPDCNSSLVERSCTVPAGKALFFPLLNTACLDAEAKFHYCAEAGPFISEIRAVLANTIDQTAGLQVTVDGKRIKGNLKKDFRVQSPVYSTILPDQNTFQAILEPEIVAGTYLGVDDGIYVMLEPLSKGHHTLNFKGTFLQFDFSLDVTYHITVE